MASMRKGRKLGTAGRAAGRAAEPPAKELFEVTAGSWPKGDSAPETPKERDFKALSSDMMSMMTCDTAHLDPGGAKSDVNYSLEIGSGPGVALSPEFSPPLSR